MSGFLAGPRPRAFAHRGWHTGNLAGLENSMAAFRAAVSNGVPYLETDVHVTGDGQLIAFHDDRLDRTTDRTGAVSGQDWASIREAKIGGIEPIPTLREVLTAFPDTMVNIDPKSDRAVGPLIDVIVDTGAAHRVCLGSFSGRRLRTLRAALGPQVATSLGPAEVAELLRKPGAKVRRAVAAGAVAAQVPVRYGRLRVITERFVRRAHDLGLEVHAWVIDEPAEMGRLLDMGVDGIVSDRPDLLLALLAERDAAAGSPGEGDD